jgi:hypothetical protein
LIAVVSFIIGFIWQLRKNRLCCWREKDEHTGRNIPRQQPSSREHLHTRNSESNGQYVLLLLVAHSCHVHVFAC